MSYLTPDELLMMPAYGELPVIGNVSRTQFSIARHTGAVSISGKTYTYMPATDELIRDDLLKAITKGRKK